MKNLKAKVLENWEIGFVAWGQERRKAVRVV